MDDDEEDRTLESARGDGFDYAPPSSGYGVSVIETSEILVARVRGTGLGDNLPGDDVVQLHSDLRRRIAQWRPGSILPLDEAYDNAVRALALAALDIYEHRT
jgi:hypothetical protein